MALLAGATLPLIAQTPPGDPRPIERGQKTFVTTCSFCHGTRANGGQGGPDLLRSVLVLDDNHGDKIGPVILNGRPGAGMPKFSLAPSQISDIADFLHNSIHAAAERGGYQILNIVTGNAKAGQAYFDGAGKCATCHSVAGDLKGIGSKHDPAALQGMILMPRGDHRGQSARTGSTALTVTVTLASGRTFSGALEAIDDFSVALRDSKGEYHSFTRNGDVPAVEVNDPLKVHSDMLTRYTDADIHNLLAYLVTLK